MQEDAHLTRLCCGIPIPLTLLAQRAGTTTTVTSPEHDAQTAIGFSALLMRDQLLVGRATQCPVWLERKVLAREATSFPGQAHMRKSIARGRDCVRRDGWGRWESRSKFGRAHRIRMKLMSQRTA